MDTWDDYHSCPFQEYLPQDSNCILFADSAYYKVPKNFNLLGLSRCQSECLTYSLTPPKMCFSLLCTNMLSL